MTDEEPGLVLEDITPEGSAAPVYLDPTPDEPVEVPALVPLVPEVDVVARAAAVAELVALGLSEDAARTLAGVSAS